jgi:hypothetical protein
MNCRATSLFTAVLALFWVGGKATAQDRSPNWQVPAGLGNRQLAQLGVLDVTQAPFNADPTGQTDSTQALQQAINFARDNQMVAYFPVGTYRISNSLNAVKNGGGPTGTQLWNWSKLTPCILVGAAASNNNSRRKRTARMSSSARAKILLSPNSPGFNDPSNPKDVINFWSRNSTNDPNSSEADLNMNQMLVNIDITVGQGNPGAVAVSHNSCQGSGVQDSTIDVTYGLTGIQGGAGSGGSHAGVTIIGGQIGLDLRLTQNAPTITGITLIGQTQTAILEDAAQTLTAVGIKIVSGIHGPLITSPTPVSPASHGQLSLIDSEIDFETPDTAGKNIAIAPLHSLYLNNVYVQNAAKLVSNPDGSQLAANPQGWMNVAEYADGIKPPLYQGKYQYQAPVYLDGVRSTNAAVSGVATGQAPPADLELRHLWASGSFPTWESPGAANVKAAPYNAKGDGATDDTAAIQRAINENTIVFLPKGQYCVSKTLQLNSGTKLVGVAQHLSLFVVCGASGDFADPTNPQPVIQTNDDPDAQTVLSFVGGNIPQEVTGAYALNWQCGRNSIYRTVMFLNRPLGSSTPPARNSPMVIISNNGGGRWYNYYAEYYTNQGPDYRHLLVDGTSEPLYFYQVNPEHARGDSNMEIRNSQYVSIYGLKSEGNYRVLWIRNSDNVCMFGYGGDAAAYEGTSLFRVESTPDFLIANPVDQPRLPGVGSDSNFAGRGVDPNLWYMIVEETADGTEIESTPLDRPVLYRRGQPVGQ